MAKKNNKQGFDWGKYLKKGTIRLSYRFIEMLIILAGGWLIGLRIIHL